MREVDFCEAKRRRERTSPSFVRTYFEALNVSPSVSFADSSLISGSLWVLALRGDLKRLLHGTKPIFP